MGPFLEPKSKLLPGIDKQRQVRMYRCMHNNFSCSLQSFIYHEISLLPENHKQIREGNEATGSESLQSISQLMREHVSTLVLC
jgi:hypothetical protein